MSEKLTSKTTVPAFTPDPRWAYPAGIADLWRDAEDFVSTGYKSGYFRPNEEKRSLARSHTDLLEALKGLMGCVNRFQNQLTSDRMAVADAAIAQALKDTTHER